MQFHYGEPHRPPSIKLIAYGFLITYKTFTQRFKHYDITDSLSVNKLATNGTAMMHIECKCKLVLHVITFYGRESRN